MTSTTRNEKQGAEEAQLRKPTKSLEIQVRDSYSAADRSELAGGEKDPSQTTVYQLRWRPTERHIFLLENGKRVCHVGIVEQAVEVQGNCFCVAGIGGVLVRQESRGRGYCRLAIEAAEALVAREARLRFLLLFCRPAIQGLYEHLGWVRVPNPVWAEQPQATVLLPLASMVKALSTEEWPEGELHLGCLPW
jgi:GNAT superfamily N-acetyltransferase